MALVGEAFTTEWSEIFVFELLKNGVSHLETPLFQEAVTASADLASLQTALGLFDEYLANTQSRFDAIRAERNRRKSIVKVCGTDFDSFKDNLSQLWNFLSTHISDVDLATPMQFNLTMPVELALYKRTVKAKGNAQIDTWSKSVRQPKAVDELVGLAGEIHVFRMLRHQYGEDAVPSSAWVSENGRRVFRFNQADDMMGCDFAFTVKGR
ncbi:hypothetical protein HR51_21010 [Burkholderia cepacia]|nr:hypothetical protein HR51_21010 [Burkholderia cepacia]